MADLPSATVNISRVFSQIGLDFCDPFQVKILPGRCKQVRKCFIATFACFSLKTIRLELISDLTTESFLEAFKRFTARTGHPIEIHSDNGTIFVGANNELKKVIKSLFTNKKKRYFFGQ